MRPSRKLLFGAAGLTIAASGLLMGVGSASASICTTQCGDTTLPVFKLETANAGKAQVPNFTFVKVYDKTSPVFLT